MRGLTDQQKLFCRLYAESDKIQESAIKAGYAKTSAHVTASKMLKQTKIIEYISFHKKSMEEIFADKAKDMLNVLLEVAQDKKSPTASRVKAAEGVLSRAGYVAPTKVEGSIKHNVSGNVTSTERKEVHIIQQLVNSNDDVADAILGAMKDRNKLPAIPAQEEEKPV